MNNITNRLPYIERLSGYDKEFPLVFNTPYGIMHHAEAMTTTAAYQFARQVLTVLGFSEQGSDSNFHDHGVYYVVVFLDRTVQLMVTDAFTSPPHWSRTGRVRLVPANANRSYKPILYRDWVVNEGLNRDWVKESLMAQSLKKQPSLWQRIKDYFN